MGSVTIEDLKTVVALSDLPDQHLQWILENSEYGEYEDGTQIKKTGDEADVMIIIIEGRITFYFDYHGRLVYYFYYANDALTGGVGGLLPYSRMKVYPGCSFTGGHLRCLKLHKKYFQELEQLNPAFIQRLIGYMTERAKLVATTQSHHEKVNALGQLAAGIAHEMNNPAAAIRGIAEELTKRFDRNLDFTKNLLQVGLKPAHLDHIRLLVEHREDTPVNKGSTLQRLEKEDEIAGWLENTGITSREMAETFSEYGFSTKELEGLRLNVGPTGFNQVIPWLENWIGSQQIINDLAHASIRISDLVTSIKSHVHMDRTNELQPTHIGQDIENTLTLLGFKIREKNIKVIRKFASDLPEVPVYVGEMNQVWTNLLDNAIAALEKGGVLTVETSRDDQNLMVLIQDNGGGIPKDIQQRIFEPFFTTKKVGEGTGIGLDIVKRIVKNHQGEVKVTSEPGRTEFLVTIPLVQQSASK